MSRTLIAGSTVLANGDLGTITDGALLIEDGIITEVGERTRLEAHGPFEAELGGAIWNSDSQRTFTD
ncbi:MAG: hypothetical protein OXI84_09950 [bacterium]|nr:hypothetical protein [bacterium]